MTGEYGAALTPFAATSQHPAVPEPEEALSPSWVNGWVDHQGTFQWAQALLVQKRSLVTPTSAAGGSQSPDQALSPGHSGP